MERQVLLGNKANYSKMRPTEMKFNTMVYPPNEATVKSEAEILVQSDHIRRCIKDYMDSVIEDTILTKNQEEGRARISKRVREGSAVITFTDKDSRVVICPPGLYIEAAEKHLFKD